MGESGSPSLSPANGNIFNVPVTGLLYPHQQALIDAREDNTSYQQYGYKNQYIAPNPYPNRPLQQPRHQRPVEPYFPNNSQQSGHRDAANVHNNEGFPITPPDHPNAIWSGRASSTNYTMNYQGTVETDGQVMGVEHGDRRMEEYLQTQRRENQNQFPIKTKPWKLSLFPKKLKTALFPKRDRQSATIERSPRWEERGSGWYSN